jgi:hypothetical protein
MMYNCENCCNWFDDDYHPVQYLLIDSKECEICEDCAIEDEDEDDPI